MAKEFIAEHYSNCAECEDLIEPGDKAGYLATREGALCEECFDWCADEEEGYEID